MFDCANVEMRELLPELVAGSLDASSRARVEAHVRECAECASELETLRLVRASFAAVPAIDTARIVASLPKPPMAAPQLKRAPRAARWADWRVAAALTMITVGGLSVAVTQRMQHRNTIDTAIDTASQIQIDSSLPGASTTTVQGVVSSSGSSKSVPSTSPSAPATAKVQLGFGGTSDSDLDDEAFLALLSALDAIDSGPVAPSAEPDPAPVMPVIREDSR